jgi:hypothetical protein
MNTSTTRAAAFTKATLASMAALMLLGGSGCASTQPAVTDASSALIDVAVVVEPTHPVLTGAKRDLRFSLIADEMDVEAGARFRESLMNAGYQLVSAEMTADLTLHVAEEEAAADDASSQRLSLKLHKNGAIVQWLVGAADEASDLVDRLTTSSELASIAAAFAQNKGAQPQAERAPSIEIAEVVGSPALSGTLARRCRDHRSRAACSKVADYVDAYPQGRDAQLARAVLRRTAYARSSVE